MIRPWMASREAAGTLDPYLRSIRADSLLTAEEERELAAAIARGDREATARMIRANLRLVVRIAREYLGRGLPLDDLVGEGNLGLIRAVRDYDPAFGTRFSTYAAHWIRQAIRQALLTTAETIRLPAHMVGLLTRWRRAERLLRRDLGREPSAREIADALELSEAQRGMVEQALRARRLRLDGDRPGGSDSSSFDEAAVAPIAAIDARPSPEEQAETSEAIAQVLRRLDRLDGRERTVVSLRFGLDGHEPMTLKEVGRRLGVTREWVRKIEVRAVRKLDDAPAAPPPPAMARLRRRAVSVG